MEKNPDSENGEIPCINWTVSIAEEIPRARGQREKYVFHFHSSVGKQTRTKHSGHFLLPWLLTNRQPVKYWCFNPRKEMSEWFWYIWVGRIHLSIINMAEMLSGWESTETQTEVRKVSVCATICVFLYFSLLLSVPESLNLQFFLHTLPPKGLSLLCMWSIHPFCGSHRNENLQTVDLMALKTSQASFNILGPQISCKCHQLCSVCPL